MHSLACGERQEGGREAVSLHQQPVICSNVLCDRLLIGIHKIEKRGVQISCIIPRVLHLARRDKLCGGGGSTGD
jgi:hypothetical protein